MKKDWWVLLCVCLGMQSTLESTQTVSGNGTLPYTFAQSVTVSASDSLTGTLYLGLAAGAGTYALASIIGPVSGPQPVAQPIAPSTSSLNNVPIELLTLSTTLPNGPSYLACVSSSTPTQLFLTTTTGATFTPGGPVTVESAALVDAAGTTITGIIDIAASSNFIFAAVSPNGGGFGTANSGIAVAYITTTATGCTNCVTGITQTAANAQSSTIQSKKVDPSTPQLFISEGPATIEDAAALVWDNALQTLFIGLQLTTPETDEAGIRGLLIGQVTSSGQLNLNTCAPDSAFSSSNQNSIIGTISNGAAASISLIDIGVLHATTGPSYLIVNGGNGLATTVNNMVYALPLVDTPSSPTINGTLANAQSALVNNVFVTPAANPADLVTAQNPAALIGRGRLPVEASTAISGMSVVGDTVYVALSCQQSAQNDTGLFFSEALFDATGKIVSWTPWARAFPFSGVAGKLTTGRISFFSVDALTSNIWAVDGEDNQTVVVTQWDQGNGGTSLAATINDNLTQGCFSILDLNGSTKGFANNAVGRYALFGSIDTILFALTGQQPIGQTSTTITTDFSAPGTFLQTHLPYGSGPVSSLAYTSFSAPNLTNNSFFAGTPMGLFQSNTIDPTTFGLLSAGPFTTLTWNQRTDISGSVTALCCSSNGTYVATFTTTPANPSSSSLYLIPPGQPAQLIAQTGTGSFQDCLKFNGVSFVSTNDDGTTEQLILSTNNGLFCSSRAGGIQQTNSNQSNANWQCISSNQPTISYLAIRAPQSPPPVTTVWPIGIGDAGEAKSFSLGTISQVSCTSDTGPFSFVPENFNAIDGSSTIPSVVNLWSDGARRIFIARLMGITGVTNYLISLPFNIELWGIDETDQTMIAAPGLLTTQFFTCCALLQTSGIVMCGTNSGVVALE